MRRASILVLALLGAGAAIAEAQRAEITQLIFTPAGFPKLVANPAPDGGKGKVVEWRRCPPDAPCEQVPTEGSDQRVLEPGPALAGTVFEVDARSDAGEITTDRSPPWRGDVTATAPPAVTGALRVGRIARPVLAEWSGGWPGDTNTLRLEACRHPAGRGCETLSDREYLPTCRDHGAVIGPRYRGWWIRAMNQRHGEGAVFSLIGYLTARAIPMPQSSSTVVRSALAGPVRHRSGRFAECGRPRISIYPRAARGFGRLRFATVDCVTGCAVLLTVRDDRRTIRRRPEPSPFGIGLSRRTRLVGRDVMVRVAVNGRHVKKRRVRLP